MSSQLLRDCLVFCKTHDMAESTFGREAVEDWRFLKDLKGEGREKPRRVWPETEERVRHFMATYKPEQAAA